MYKRADRYLMENFGEDRTWVDRQRAKIDFRGLTSRKGDRIGSLYTWKGMYLLDKHLRAWVDLLESGSAFVLVFEDDAWLRVGEESAFTDFLPTLLSGEAGEVDYVDLCGHFDFYAMFPDFSKAIRERRGDWFRVPLLTNTNCAYIMSRRLAGVFIDMVMEQPDLRRLNSDWVVNCLVADMPRSERPTCWMRLPGPVENRSLVSGQSNMVEQS